MPFAKQQSLRLHPRIEELIEYIAEHRRRVHEAVAEIPSHLTGRRPSRDQWSVAEVVEHLSITEHGIARLLTKYVTAARANGVGPDPDTSSVVASYANPGAMTDRSTKLVAPPPVRPTGTIDANAGTQALVMSRAAMISALQNANGVSLEQLTHPHPALGPLNMYHWAVFVGLHDVRHAAQIRDIGQSLAAG
ncbi:MAG: DinB family protein [Gemmatimonadota bacterium]